MTSTWKVAPCLAFGNTAVLKMSELSPLSASRLGELALEAGLPAGVLNIVHGLGVETGEPLCSHPDVRAISFTGDRKSVVSGKRFSVRFDIVGCRIMNKKKRHTYTDHIRSITHR